MRRGRMRMVIIPLMAKGYPYPAFSPKGPKMREPTKIPIIVIMLIRLAFPPTLSRWKSLLIPKYITRAMIPSPMP
jgi:hypothetical protein